MKSFVYSTTLACLMSCSASVIPHTVSKCLSNTDVMHMSRNKVSTDVMLSSINNNCCRCFTTTLDDLIDLKDQGVPGVVIKRMIQLNNPKLARPVSVRPRSPRIPSSWYK